MNRLIVRRGADPQAREGFGDIAVGLGGDHPRRLMNGDAEGLVRVAVNHAARTVKALRENRR
jgi:hypothetical protein